MKINDEKKSAIKLINQYAERYNRVDMENKELLNEIEDLKKNLKISKEIIESFFKAEQKEKSKIFLKKTKEEIKLLNDTIDTIRKNLKEARDKNTYYEVIINESILKYQESTEDLKKKIFLLDNLIKKKDAVICYLNIKLNSLYESAYLGSDCDVGYKELYLIEPSTSVLLVHNELAELQGKFNNLMEKYEETVGKCKKLQNENEDLKNTDTENSCSKSRDKKNNSGGTVVSVKKEENNNNYTIDLKGKNWEKDEWIKILKKAKISSDTISNFANTKIGESIEILVKMIMEKNMQIRVIYKENENLNEKNAILLNEIFEYKKKITNLKNEVKNLQNKFNQFDKSIILSDFDKQKFEVSLNLEKKNQYKNYEKYLDEFNSKTQRINDSVLEDEIKECYKSFITNDSTINKKKNEIISIPQVESFISETMRKSDNLFNQNENNKSTEITNEPDIQLNKQ